MLLAPLVLLLVLPAPAAHILAAVAFATAGVAERRRQLLGWIGFGASTLLLGSLTYALVIPGEPVLRLGPLALSLPGFRAGLLDMVRLLGFLSLGLLAARWICTRDLLPWAARRPLPFYVMGSLVRLMPTIRDDADRIREAQSARGFRPRGSWLHPGRWLALLVPLFVGTVRRAREQALVLETAGLGPRRDEETTRHAR